MEENIVVSGKYQGSHIKYDSNTKSILLVTRDKIIDLKNKLKGIMLIGGTEGKYILELKDFEEKLKCELNFEMYLGLIMYA